MIVKLLTEHHLEFVSLKGGCRGSSESTHAKLPHCWKSHCQFIIVMFNIPMMLFRRDLSFVFLWLLLDEAECVMIYSSIVEVD